MAVTCFVTFFLSLRNWTLAASAMFVNVLPVGDRRARYSGPRAGRSTWPPCSSWAFPWASPSMTRASSSTSISPAPAGARRAGVGARPHRPVDDRDLPRHRDRLQRAAGVGVHAHAHVRRDDGRRPGAGHAVRSLRSLVSASCVFRRDERTSIMWKTLLLVLASCMLMAAQAPETGRDIARKAQVAQFTFKTLKASGEMTLARGSDIDRPARALRSSSSSTSQNRVRSGAHHHQRAHGAERHAADLVVERQRRGSAVAGHAADAARPAHRRSRPAGGIREQRLLVRGHSEVAG